MTGTGHLLAPSTKIGRPWLCRAVDAPSISITDCTTGRSARVSSLSRRKISFSIPCNSERSSEIILATSIELPSPPADTPSPYRHQLDRTHSNRPQEHLVVELSARLCGAREASHSYQNHSMSTTKRDEIE